MKVYAKQMRVTFKFFDFARFPQTSVRSKVAMEITVGGDTKMMTAAASEQKTAATRTIIMQRLVKQQA